MIAIPLPLGQVVFTQAVDDWRRKDLVARTALLRSLLERHQARDWGDMSQADKDQNDEALRTGGHIYSSYELPEHGQGVKIWIITEPDHSVTTVLFPSDY